MVSYSRYFLFFVLASCPLSGQEIQRKSVQPQDYDLWGTMDFLGISDNGNWVSYNLRYNSGNDTLFVRNIAKKKTYALMGGYNGKFIAEDFFVALRSESELSLIDLNNGKKTFYKNVDRYNLSAGDNILLLESDKLPKEIQLSLVNFQSGHVLDTKTITTYQFNSSGGGLAYSVNIGKGSALIHRSLKTQTEDTLMILPGRHIDKIRWDPSGKVLALSSRPKLKMGQESDSIILHYYSFSERKVETMAPKTTFGFPKQWHIRSRYPIDLFFSVDGNAVFFYLEKDKDITPSDFKTPEVWNTLDKRDFSERTQTGSVDDWTSLAVWYPASDQFFWFTQGFTDSILIPNHNLALVSSIESKQPQFKEIPDRDYYLVDLKERSKKLLLPDHSGSPLFIKIAPSGCYILYFNKEGWNVYDTRTGTRRNLTTPIATSFMNREDEYPNNFIPYGLGGFTPDETSVLLYDRNDIWQVDLDGQNSKRLTRGKEKKLVFRFEMPEQKYNKDFWQESERSHSIDPTKKQILRTTTVDNSISGFSIWKGEEKPWIMDDNLSTTIKKAAHKEVYVYVTQDFNTPPALMVMGGKGKKPELIFQSNPHYKKYQWGTARYISYRNKDGRSLRGCLFYPAGYDPKERYPMIVEIYQKQVDKLHRYENPSLYNPDGFNVANLTIQGYFVLLPDIVYNYNAPGIEALECVKAAVGVSLKTASIDPERIGINGHSFGGYETNYILTQTELFTTAVSGASLSDLLSSYFSISPNYGKAEFWRYERNQMRMGIPFFEDKRRYLENSPIYYADKINTPLLLWTGKEDTQVPPQQSMELFLALRRLGKRAILLQYPGEWHGFSDRLTQKDLTLKIECWFGHYLKGKSKPSWMDAK